MESLLNPDLARVDLPTWGEFFWPVPAAESGQTAFFHLTPKLFSQCFDQTDCVWNNIVENFQQVFGDVSNDPGDQTEVNDALQQWNLGIVDHDGPLGFLSVREASSCSGNFHNFPTRTAGSRPRAA
jgi:hypothetical protein